MQKIENKKNLRQFLFDKGTIIANVNDLIVGEDETLVLYYEGAVALEKEDLEFIREPQDILYLVKKADL